MICRLGRTTRSIALEHSPEKLHRPARFGCSGSACLGIDFLAWLMP